MNRSLMTITVESLAFLELCQPDVIQQDVAVSQTHEILSGLETLSDAEKAEFVDFAHLYARHEEAAGAPPQRVRFLRSIPLLIGCEE